MSQAENTGKNIADRPKVDDVLGYTRAQDIACESANTDRRNLSRTLDELGVNGISFQGTVFNAIGEAGYTIDIDSIPDSPSSTLLSVVAVIQNAKRVSQNITSA
ncbi:MAG TPA: hypothetical protein VGG85_10590 [Terracidiphilus sp.]|jgi:hypothetical protein